MNVNWVISCTHSPTRPDRLERGGPCWLLKLRWTGTQRVHAYESGPFFVGSLCLSCRYKRFLFCLGCSIVGSVQNIFFPNRTLFQFMCPHRQATWAGSRAGSEYVSPYQTLCCGDQWDPLTHVSSSHIFLAIVATGNRIGRQQKTMGL